MAHNETAIQRFQEYLRIKTEQPKPDYAKCTEFLFNYAKELGFQSWSHEVILLVLTNKLFCLVRPRQTNCWFQVGRNRPIFTVVDALFAH